MEKITHLNQMENGHYQNKGICGQQTNCGVYQFSIVPPAVHHCITREINNVSCADCADTYAQQQYSKQDAKLTLNQLYGKGMLNMVMKDDLDTAFKIIAARDVEIVRLERENKQLTSELSKSSNQVFGLNVQNERLKRENTNLNEKVHTIWKITNG